MVHSVMSCDQGPGMFSNNNYLPDVGQFSNNNAYVNRCQPPAGMTGNQGVQFTFAVPTQANTYSFTLGSTHQPRGIYSNPIYSQSTVPGMGTPWQHSIPNPMPWSEDLAQRGNSGVSSFSAYPPVSSSFSIYSNIPSCSKTPRRPKRHSTTEIEKEAPGSKCRLTEEKMAARMEGLSLICTGISLANQSTGYQFQSSADLDLDLDQDSTQTDDSCAFMSEDWKKFRELENRLNSESEEDEIQEGDKGVKVHISKDIAKNIMETPTLIPQEILSSLQKPCMELVLWKSPGGFDKENIKTTSESTNTSENQAIPSSVQLPSATSDALSLNDMEPEGMECIDEEMDL